VKGSKKMNAIWEWVKFLGMILFCLGMMAVHFTYIHGSGKGWNDGRTAIELSWPKSRLLNSICFHLFYFGLFFVVDDFIQGRLSTQVSESYEELFLPMVFILIGLTNLLATKYLWGKPRKGRWYKIDKSAPIIIRIIGVFFVVFGVLLILNVN
jgi:hypothetical protein